jgi:hypothetical protein
LAANTFEHVDCATHAAPKRGFAFGLTLTHVLLCTKAATLFIYINMEFNEDFYQEFYNSERAAEMAREYSLRQFASAELNQRVQHHTHTDTWARRIIEGRQARGLGVIAQDILCQLVQLRTDYALLGKANMPFSNNNAEFFTASVAADICAARALITQLGCFEQPIQSEKCAPGLPFIKPGVALLKKRLLKTEVELAGHLSAAAIQVTNQPQCETVIALAIQNNERLKKLL